MVDSYKERVTLLTGSNGGLGHEIADYLLSTGFTRVICHYNSSCDEIVKVLKKHDIDPTKHLVQANLSDEGQVSKIKQEIDNRFGAVSNLINLAGTSTSAVTWKLEEADFRKVIDASLVSTFLCCKHFIPNMRGNNFGRIINTSSILAYSGAVGVSHYSAAKAGVIGFTKSLALEVASFGITANAIALGYFNAGLIEHIPIDKRAQIKNSIPLKRLGDPKEIGGLLSYLLSDESAYMTGQVLQLNGGLYL